MNVTVDLYAAQNLAGFVAGNVPSKTPMQILKAVSIKAVEPGLLIMEATDMIAHVRQAIEANVQKPGEVFVDAQLLNGILIADTCNLKRCTICIGGISCKRNL